MTQETQLLIEKGTETIGFDPRKLSKKTIRALIIGIPAFFLLFHYKEDLVTMAWDMVSIGEAAICGLVLFAVLGVIWNQLGHFSDFMSKTCLGWWIEYNPWVLQFKQIDDAEEKWEKTIKEKEKVLGTSMKLKGKLENAQLAFKEAKAAEEILRQKLKNPPSNTSPEGILQWQQMLQDEQQKQVDNLNYIQINGPLVQDLEKIMGIIKNAQIVMKHKIERMRNSLRQLQDTFESSEVGKDALNAMQQCLTGNRILNNEADQSKLKVLQDIAMNLGQMKSSVEIINEITASSNLQDAAKLKVAQEQLLSLGINDGVIPINSYQTSNFNNMVTINDTKFMLPE